jgi:hypothetical protein
MNGPLDGGAYLPYASEPVFLTDQAGQIKPDIPIVYYIGCATTENAIYALFAGRHEKAGEVPSECAGRFVHVFDWTGRLVRIYSLSQPVDQIAVDEPSRGIVGVCYYGASVWTFGI